MNDFIEVLIDEEKQASAVLNEVRWGGKIPNRITNF